MKPGRRRRAVALAEFPGALGPLLGCGARDYLGEIHPSQPRKFTGARQRRRLVGIRARCDAARLCAFFPNHPGQPPRIYAGDGNHILVRQVALKRRIRPPVASSAAASAE